MASEYFEHFMDTFALGAGDPGALRSKLLEQLADLGLELPGTQAIDDAALAPLEPHTLIALVDDSAFQGMLLVYADSSLPDSFDPLRVNGVCAGGPDDLGDEHLPDAARLLALVGVGPQPGDWFQPDDPHAVGADELQRLSKIKAVDGVVIDEGGTIWKHGRKPSAQLLARRFSRVVSFNLAM